MPELTDKKVTTKPMEISKDHPHFDVVVVLNSYEKLNDEQKKFLIFLLKRDFAELLTDAELGDIGCKRV